MLQLCPCSFYFVDNQLVMHNKASYKYTREDAAQAKKSYENRYDHTAAGELVYFVGSLVCCSHGRSCSAPAWCPSSNRGDDTRASLSLLLRYGSKGSKTRKPLAKSSSSRSGGHSAEHDEDDEDDAPDDAEAKNGAPKKVSVLWRCECMHATALADEVTIEGETLRATTATTTTIIH